MEITLKEITQTTRPSLMTRNHVCFDFFLKSKIYNYIHFSDSPSPEFIGLETFDKFNDYKPNIDKFYSEESVAAGLDTALAALIFCSTARKNLVDCAMEELLRALKTEPLCRSKCRYRMDIELEIETVCRHVYHYDMDMDMDVEMVPAAQSSIRSLNKYGIHQTEDRSCSVCLEDFVAGEELVAMPCDHVFHGGCIHKWLSTSHYCPLCRFQMPTAVEFLE